MAKDKIGFNNEDKNVFNSIGDFYLSKANNKISFVKNDEKLLKSYNNLIKNIGRKYDSYCTSEADRQDLYSYISECFLLLVHEFSLTNTMDFPGYINNMLNARVHGSYINKNVRRMDREAPIKQTEHSVEDLIDNYSENNSNIVVHYRKKTSKNDEVCRIAHTQVSNEIDTSILELIDTLQREGACTDIILDMILMFSKGADKATVIDSLADKYQLSKLQITDEYNILKEHLSSIYNIKD